MAGLAGSSDRALCPPCSYYSILAGDFYLYYPTYLSLQPLFDQLDSHHELHDPVSAESARVSYGDTDMDQDADSPSLGFLDLMARSVPLHEHVHQITSGAAKERASH